MRTRHKQALVFGAAIFLALVFFALIEAGSIPKYAQLCRQTKESDHQDCATYHVALFIFLKIGKFLDDHAGAIAAIATGFIGYYTFTLYRATEQLKSISERQIQSLADLERPWLFFSGTHIKRRENRGDPILANYYWISFRCKNVGRAPAIIEECIVKFQDVKTLPKVPDYSDPAHLQCPATVAVGADFETSAIGPPSQPGLDLNNATEYVIYGRLSYKELNGRKHHSRFAVRVSPVMAASTAYFSDTYDQYD